MASLTINEALITLKTLRERHAELVALRNDNAHSLKRFYGAHADKETEKTPVYDVKALDKLVTQVASEIRRLELALKKANASTVVQGYDWNDSVLGEIS